MMSAPVMDDTSGHVGARDVVADEVSRIEEPKMRGVITIGLDPSTAGQPPQSERACLLPLPQPGRNLGNVTGKIALPRRTLLQVQLSAYRSDVTLSLGGFGPANLAFFQAGRGTPPMEYKHARWDLPPAFSLTSTVF
jgi:hypothetical protein